jgi:uncharacterized RDD family membrane protein YckC/DNA-binding transcriptional ArsR family regulator
MSVDQENITKILSVLSHPLRREILGGLSEKGEQSFTDLAKTLEIDSAKLSFHIRSLTGFLEQTPNGKYSLSRLGENAVRLLKDLELWAVETNTTNKGLSFPIASFERRSLAFFIDFAMTIAFFVGITILSNLLFSFNLGNLFILRANDVILFLLLFWVYLTLLEGFAGQSLGKRAVGLRVVRVDGKKISYDTVAVRNFGKVFLLPVDIILGLRLHDDRFVRYFDKFAGTMVIDLHSDSQ